MLEAAVSGLVLCIPTGNQMGMAFGRESRFLKDPSQKEDGKAQGLAAFPNTQKKIRASVCRDPHFACYHQWEKPPFPSQVISTVFTERQQELATAYQNTTSPKHSGGRIPS